MAAAPVPIDADASDRTADARIVAAQIGRRPRDPWRVASRCSYGFPNTIASPAVLDDGDRFPQTYWLSCPFLADAVAAEESAGATSRWAERAARDAELADALRLADAQLRERRAEESGGVDPVPQVGLAGQRDPLGVKCLHAHVAYACVGIDDPIGRELLATFGETCPDRRCTRLTEEA